MRAANSAGYARGGLKTTVKGDTFGWTRRHPQSFTMEIGGENMGVIHPRAG
jgi:hypothetical protein